MSKQQQQPQEDTPVTPPSSARIIIVDVPLGLVLDNPYQTRQSYDGAAIGDLAADIRARGLLQPPVARPVSTGNAPGFVKAMGLDKVVNMDLYAGPTWGPSILYPAVQLAFGHTRARACRAAGMATMPVSLRVLTDEEMAEMAWSENERRSDVNPVDAARALERMATNFGWTQASIAERLGIDRSTVSNKLRLLRLPQSVLQALSDGTMSERKAVALLAVYPMPDGLEEHADAFARGDWRGYSRANLTEWALGEDVAADNVRSLTATLVDHVQRSLQEQARSAESRAAAAKKVEAAKAQALADGLGDLPMLDDLPTPNQRFYGNPKGECAAGACACFRRALTSWGTVESVCIDPTRQRSVSVAATKAAKKEARADIAGDISARVAAAFADGTPARIAARILCLAARGGDARSGDLRAACAQLGIDEATTTALSGSTHDEPTIEAWISLGTEQATELAARTHVAAWQRLYVEFPGKHTFLKSELYRIEADSAALPDGWTVETTKGGRFGLYGPLPAGGRAAGAVAPWFYGLFDTEAEAIAAVRAGVASRTATVKREEVAA